MPEYDKSEYIRLFGDEHANDDRDTGLLGVYIKDISDIQRAITGISIVRNKQNSHYGLTPEQFAARQQVLTMARAVLVSERKKRLEQMFTYWSGQRESKPK